MHGARGDSPGEGLTYNISRVPGNGMATQAPQVCWVRRGDKLVPAHVRDNTGGGYAVELMRGGEAIEVSASDFFEDVAAAVQASRDLGLKLTGVFQLCEPDGWGGWEPWGSPVVSYEAAFQRCEEINAGSARPKGRRLKPLPINSPALMQGQGLSNTAVLKHVGVRLCESESIAWLTHGPHADSGVQGWGLGSGADVEAAVEIIRRSMHEYSLHPPPRAALAHELHTLVQGSKAAHGEACGGSQTPSLRPCLGLRPCVWVYEAEWGGGEGACGGWVGGKSVVGVVALEPVTATCHPGFVPHLPVLELKRFFVSKLVRGRGVGSALLECALSNARCQGAARVFIQTSRRFVEARSLYMKHGFCVLQQGRTAWETDFLALDLGPAANINLESAGSQP